MTAASITKRRSLDKRPGPGSRLRKSSWVVNLRPSSQMGRVEKETKALFALKLKVRRRDGEMQRHNHVLCRSAVAVSLIQRRRTTCTFGHCSVQSARRIAPVCFVFFSLLFSSSLSPWKITQRHCSLQPTCTRTSTSTTTTTKNHTMTCYAVLNRILPPHNQQSKWCAKHGFHQSHINLHHMVPLSPSCTGKYQQTCLDFSQ